MTIYLVCYDLRVNPKAQLQQILYWLEYLNAILVPDSKDSSWEVIIVGLCSDKCKDKEASKNIVKVSTWKSQIPNIPISSKTFMVSSYIDKSSLLELLSELEQHFSNLFLTYTAEIPTIYRNILEHVQTTKESHKDRVQAFWKDIDVHLALRFLHSIGEIVYLPNGMIFPNPSIISSIFAQFVSPEHVQLELASKMIAQEEGVPRSLLSVDKISSLLKTTGQSTRFPHSNFRLKLIYIF